MGNEIEIFVNASPDLLANPPPQYAHLNVLYTAFGLRVGSESFPSSIWCDFAGIWLFQWYEAIWNMAEYKTRAVRLPFFYTYEVWLRRTTALWWKLSYVERHAHKNIETDTKVIGKEFLVIPEQVELAALQAIRKLLSGAIKAGRWTEDCIALEALAHDPRGYLRAIQKGSIKVPAFLRSGFKVPV
jgi:hypothetical protein